MLQVDTTAETAESNIQLHLNTTSIDYSNAYRKQLSDLAKIKPLGKRVTNTLQHLIHPTILSNYCLMLRDIVIDE